MTSGSKAAVLTAEHSIDAKAVDALLARVVEVTNRSNRTDFELLNQCGTDAAALLLPRLIIEALEGLRPGSLTLINDLWSSRIPWEIVAIPAWTAGKDGNLSRRYATSNLTVANWLHERRAEARLRLLLVVNPTEDLSGAQREGDRIALLVREHTDIESTVLQGREATRDRIKSILASGQHDVLHYAGHAFFDPDNRSSSGIVCAGESVLAASDLATLESLPSLAVFNACESGRVRAARLPSRTSASAKPTARDLIDRNVSFAEAFLRGGIGSYVGTYWPVGDSGAETFATDFYAELLAGKPIGAALRKARNALYDGKNLDWANYIHYGEPAFRIKSR